MRLLKKKSLLQVKEVESAVEEKVEVKEEKPKKRKSKLPPDEYKEEFESSEMILDETRKFIFSVKRGGELGLPMCDIRQFQTTEVYTGFTKKGINFPIEMLPDVITYLEEVYEKAEEKGLIE